MKLKNTSHWPDRFIRRMIRIACQRWKHQVKRIKNVDIRNTGYENSYSGRAYLHERRFVATIGKRCTLRDVANICIHEVGHLAVYWKEKYEDRPKDRRNGKGWGGSEEYICRMTKKFVDEIRGDLDGWFEEDSDQPESERLKPTFVEKRQIKAIKAVARTEARIKQLDGLKKKAIKRLRDYESKVRYYERKLGNPDAKIGGLEE